MQPAAGVAEWILAEGVASQVVVTHGGDGATLVTRAGTLRQPPADPGAPITDTNGAGDASAAAFQAAWLTGADQATCLRSGAVAGAYACTRAVGAEAFIDRATLNARLPSAPGPS